jgi:dTDP-4-amino-4,6-dideoxygalactose transaminase
LRAAKQVSLGIRGAQRPADGEPGSDEKRLEPMRLRRLSLWPGLSPGFWRGSRPPMQYPLRAAPVVGFATARHGLYIGASVLGLGPGDEVLVPAYHHGSEVEALRRLGLIPRFYDVGENLRPDARQLEAVITPRVRALLVIHYFGFPQEIGTWRRWCDDVGLLLLEDTAQAWLADVDGAPLGSFGDIAIFCPYKTVGIPRLGLLRLPPESLKEIVSPQGPRRLAAAEAFRLGLRWAAGRFGWVASILQPFEPLRTTTAVDDQALGTVTSASLAGTWLLRHVDLSSVAARRRSNYEFLLSQLRDLVPHALRHLPAGAAPLIFPIETGDRERVLRQLNSRKILARAFWPHPHPSLPLADHPHAQRWRSSMIALPVHQELAHDDLDRIVESASSFASAYSLGANQ